MSTDYVPLPSSERRPIRRREGDKQDAGVTGMKSTLKWYAQRATLFLGTLAAFAFVIDSGKRWS